MSSAAANDSDEKPVPPEKSTVILLFTIAADTTWRMFVPTFGGLAIGSFVDSKLNSAPWGALVGLGIGIIITAVLIRQQLKNGSKK